MSVFVVEDVYASTPTGTITYSVGSDTITVVGANSSHPAEFLDLYDADVAGGWSQVSKLGDNQFYFECKIIFGDGQNLTYFTDVNKQVVFASGVVGADWGNLIEVKGNATFTLGILRDATGKGSSSGCSFVVTSPYHTRLIFASSALSVVYLYSCAFYKTVENNVYIRSDDVGATFRVYNCLLSGVQMSNRGSWDVFRVTSEECNFAVDDVDGSVDDLIVTGANYGILFTFSRNLTVSNLKVRDVGTSFYLLPWLDRYFNVVNADLSEWTIYWNNEGSGTLNRQYTFDLYVLNGALTDFVEDANVTLVHDGVVFGSWLTNSTGQVDSQTLTYGFYNQTGGNVMYGGTAWNLTITHPDWETYTSSFYPSAEIDWSISMQEVEVDTDLVINYYEVTGDWVSVRNYAGVGLVLVGLAVLVVWVVRRKG